MNIAAFAASSIMEVYSEPVRQVGEILGGNGHTLIFGGCDFGLMHEIAEGFARAGAEITGVVPGFFGERPVHPGCGSVIKTVDLTDRKEKMIELADAFLILPGGIGTLDELFTVLAKRTVGQCTKPVLVFNPDGYYDAFLQALDGMHQAGAIRNASAELVHCFQEPEQVIEVLMHE